MDNLPVLTIITPVYNGEEFIKATIESVLKANIDVSYEYIVLDDGSTDDTAKILNEFRNEIIFFSHKNIGESATVNRGLDLASGKYVLVLNADDPLLTKNLIEIGINTLESNQNVVAVYPDWIVINELGVKLKTVLLPEYSENLMVGMNKCLPGPGTIFRLSAARQIGGRQVKWKFVGDYDFWLRLSRIGELKHIPGIFAQWRTSELSTSISQRGLQMSNERISVISEFIQNNNLAKNLKKQALGNAYFMAARLAFFDKEIKGKSLFLKSFYYRRGIPELYNTYVAIYLCLLPVSSKILDYFPKMKDKITKLYSLQV